MKSGSFVLIIVLVSAILSGCTVAKISGKGPIPIILNQPQVKVEVVQNLSVSRMVAFDYTNSFDVSEILSETLFGTDADAIINCTIVIKNTPTDFLVNLITLGIAAAKTVEIKGQVVKAPEGLSNLRLPEKNKFVHLKDVDNVVRLTKGNEESLTILLKE